MIPSRPGLFVGVALVVAFARVGAANAPPAKAPPVNAPKPASASPNVAMIVKVDREATEARLIIPRKFVSGLAAVPVGNGEVHAASFSVDDRAPETPVSGSSNAGVSTSANRTMFAGLALSAAVASLVFVKRRRAAAVMGVVAAGVIAFCLTTPLAADIPPFNNKGPRPKPALVDPQPAPVPNTAPQTDPLTAAGLMKELGDDLARNVTGQVRIVVSNEANVVTLVLPKSASKTKAVEPPKSAPAP